MDEFFPNTNWGIFFSCTILFITITALLPPSAYKRNYIFTDKSSLIYILFTVGADQISSWAESFLLWLFYICFPIWEFFFNHWPILLLCGKSLKLNQVNVKHVRQKHIDKNGKERYQAGYVLGALERYKRHGKEGIGLDCLT